MIEILTRRNSVEAALNAGRRNLIVLWIQDDINPKSIASIMQAAEKANVKVRKASKQQISSRAQDSRHQGVLLEAGPYVYTSLDDILKHAIVRAERPFLLLLDLLHGPQNIGSLLRTAEICGVHGVIIQDRRAPEITPTVVQYSAGAAEYLQITQVTNLARTIEHLKDQDIWVVGLDFEEDAMLFGKADLDLPIALVIGHEGSGLRRNTKKHCDFLLRLPMRGQTESLNASVAGSIALYAAWQARGFSGTLP